MLRGCGLRYVRLFLSSTKMVNTQLSVSILNSAVQGLEISTCWRWRVS